MASAVSVTVYLYSNGLDISYFQFPDQTNQIAALALVISHRNVTGPFPDPTTHAGLGSLEISSPPPKG